MAASAAPTSPVPVHVAFIMDGNGRWARKRGLPRLMGHRAGVEAAKRVVTACGERGIRVVTLYAFSTENWQRPREEVDGLMGILSQSIDSELAGLQRNNILLRHIGALEELPEGLGARVQQAVSATSANSGLVVCIALNYGGRADIVQAARSMVRAGYGPDAIDEQAFSGHLYTAGLPDPDLIVRTAGEMRLSNFLVWQAAYSEFYSTSVYWPDFGSRELDEALAAYSQRTRKFGQVLDTQ
jgi:undecaprenyl diphosphate synthase